MMAARLTSVEGQRVMSILDDAIQKFGFISMLKKEILGSVETYSALLGEDAAIFLALKSAAQNLNVALDKEDYDTIESKSCEVEDATAMICKMMKERPTVMEGLRSIQVKVGNPKASPAFRGFVGAFNELRDLTHARLASTVEDERARNFFFADMVSKEKKMSGDLRVLVDKLAETRMHRERDSTTRKAQLAKLRDELKDMRENTINEAKELEKETTSREAFDLANFTESENAKTEELQNLQKGLDEKTATNKKKEVMLRKKKARVEKELENWIMKYDQEMEEKESELALLKQDYERELKELKETEDAYDKVMKEREEFLAEHRRRALHAKREANKKKRLDEAAIVIQRTWKRFKTRSKPPTAVVTKTKSTSKGSKNKSLSASPSKQTSTAKQKLKQKDAKDAPIKAKAPGDAPKRKVPAKK